MSGECMLLRSLSRHNKDLEWWTLKSPQRITALGSWTDRVVALRSWTDHVTALREISVTALFYLEDSRKSIFEAWGHIDPKRQKEEHPTARERERERERARMHTCWGEREKEHMHAWTRERKSVCRHGGEREREYPRVGGERGSPLAPLFMCFFLPPGPGLCKLGLGRSAALPEVLTQVLGPSLDLPPFYFRGLSPSLSFSHRHFGLLFPILTT